MLKMEKLIITVATTGAVTTKKDTPYLPTTPEEIASEVYACWQAGAAIAHIHVRDAHGNPCMDFEAFKQTVARIRERCDIILNLTTSGGLNLTDEERLRPLSLRPEMGSFDAGSMNFNDGVFINRPDFLERLGAEFQACEVKPEIEVFEGGMINNAMMVARKGLLKEPFHFQFVLGVPGGLPATPKNLLFLRESIPLNSTWSVVGVGKAHLPMATMALAMGGHIRVGMEDNVFLHRGVLAESNVQFVERIVRLAEDYGREVASCSDARRILGLPGAHESI